MQAITRWLRRPASRWARIPAGVLLIIGGCLSILPVFGLWMLPLGLILLADDIPPLRRGRGRALDWVARRRPHWFAGARPRGDSAGGRKSRLFAGTAAPCRRLTSCRFSPISNGPQSPGSERGVCVRLNRAARI